MSVEGLDKLLKKLNSLGDNINAGIVKGVSDATKKVQGDAKDLAPVDTGELRNLIISQVAVGENEVTGIVSSTAEYGMYLEFGTGQRGKNSDIPSKQDLDIAYKEDWSGIPAQPYMYPAMKQNEEYIKDTIAASVRMEIQKKGD